MANSIYHSDLVFNCIRENKICQVFTYTVVKHIVAILISIFCAGYKGKTTQFAECSPHHRTTIAHFLNNGKWDDGKLESILKGIVVKSIYDESIRTGNPIYCFVDDTISSKTKPSSQAMHPIEDAYFHQSHLKKKKDYGHQAVSVMLSCNGITLNYAIIMYDKSKSKIQIVCDIAEELPEAPVISYFLCDSWYTSAKVIEAFLVKGFYTIGAIRTNRVVYPRGIKQQLSQFSQYIRKTDVNVSLVTVGKRQYYIYRYEGHLNDVDCAVVLLSFPQNAFGVPSALRAFICTNPDLSTTEILNFYVERWQIEVFFRQAKQKLAMDKYQIRSSTGIRRYWLLMSLAHLLCCTGLGCYQPFEDGYACLARGIMLERITYIYKCGAIGVPLNKVLPFAA